MGSLMRNLSVLCSITLGTNLIGLICGLELGSMFVEERDEVGFVAVGFTWVFD